MLTASSATGFNKRKTLKLVNDLRSDVDSVLTQIPYMTANQSEVLSQLRLLTDLVVGQQAGLNGLRAELEKKSMTGNDSKQQSPYTDREKKRETGGRLRLSTPWSLRLSRSESRPENDRETPENN